MQYYVDKNELESFTYGAISSTSFNFIIVSNDNLNGFENDFELVEIPGRTGNLIIDNQRKKNKEINIEAYADIEEFGEASLVSKAIRNWLQGEVKYKTLIFSNDYVKYEAIVLGNVEIVEEIENLLNIKFKFSCKEVGE